MTHPIRQHRTQLFALLCLVALAWTGIAQAQLPIPASTQFDIEGVLQEATATTLKVNGHLVTIPANTIVIFPANALTWPELIAQAPAPYTGSATGMALSDVPAPMSTYEVHVVGNRVLGGPAGADLYIAGLIYISQEELNSGAGFINYMDYTLGEMRVGGTIGDNTTGTRVRLNDPMGRYGRAMSPDRRFTVDPDNPTITAGTGYPMCFPRTDPAVADDPLCPQGNRPQILVGNPPVATFNPSFTTANLTQTVGVNGTVLVPPPAGTFPDSTRQAPFEVGDYITFSGTLVNDTATPTAGPWAGTANTYISAHTIENNVGIWTFPGSNPAYVRTDVFILGTGGLSALGIGEATIRTRFEGFTTDVADPTLSSTPQRGIHLYGMDLAPNGTESDREYGTIGVDPGAPTGAVKGRWRFRPPCLPFGTVPTKPDKQCVTNINDTFLPVTREMRAVIEGLQSQVPGTPGAQTSANGLFYGQYHAPILDYIFPENVPGTPIVENNFNTIPFLACGGYTSAGDPSANPAVAGTLAGVLNPWPSNVAPGACAGQCNAATPSATASPATAAANTLVTLTATSGGTAPITFAFAQDPADVPQVALTVAGNQATFTAPGVAVTTTLHFTVTATNCGGAVTASVTVTINGAAAPTVSFAPAAPAQVASGTAFGPFTASCTDPANLTPCTFQWTQTAGAPILLNPNPTSNATIGSFTVNIPVGNPAVTFQFSVVATNTAGVSSAPELATITVNPQTDQVAITTSGYRFGKQRLDLTATDSSVGPNVVVTLLPYLCQGGASVQCPGGIFDPATLGNTLTNTGGGLYTFTGVGFPEPACNAPLPGGNINAPCSMVPLQIKSSLGGVSPLFPLQKTRQ